jgi:ribosomal protein RSM22 (predicted rRNA methylase)
VREDEGVLTAELPIPLRDDVERLFPGGAAPAAAAALSERYRAAAAGPGPRASSQADVAAYATTRLPATYAAAAAVLGEVGLRAPGFAPRSHLDLGAGLGAVVWAAAGLWPSLERVVAVELEPGMLEAGRRLAAAGPAAVAGCAWHAGDIGREVSAGSFDLVTIGYVLNEVGEAGAARAIEQAWAATASVLAVVEPGTPDGFRRSLEARRRLLALGGFTAAPCPHDRPCPLDGDDWCHFAVRLPRSAGHRSAKAAQAGFEDEKFAYVVVTREQLQPARARILRHPQVRGGHVRLELCAEEGLRSAVVAKSDRAAFRAARKASWGDTFGVSSSGGERSSRDGRR